MKQVVSTFWPKNAFLYIFIFKYMSSLLNSILISTQLEKCKAYLIPIR